MTIEWHQLAFYALAYFVTVVTPGPFIAAIAARSAAYGFRSAFSLALGAAIGDKIWILSAIFGLALVALGAGEGLVGLQRAFSYLAIGIQLPTLRLVGRVAKRHILVAGQLVALLGTAPLLWFADLQGSVGVSVALASSYAPCSTSRSPFASRSRTWTHMRRPSP